VTGTAADALARCATLGEISEEPDHLTRRVATPALARAGDVVAGWMEDAGMTTRRDAVGNVVGRHGAGERPFVLGSHLDTVPNAGTFDGPLGIVAAIAVVERLAAGGPQPSCPVEVVAFADEEGTRFGTSYLGSAAYIGALDPAWLDQVDADGTTLRDAIRASGGDPDVALETSPPELLGYLEVHIEQGPVLEREGLPVGVVTAIAGQTRARIVLTGEAGHAGTLPMDARHDALAAAAEAVLAVERHGRAEPGLVATVGALTLSPNVGNVVPGEVRMLLDLRHADDGVRRRTAEEVRAKVEGIAAARGVDAEWATRYETPAAVLDAMLRGRLADGIRAEGLPVRELVSGAGHDAVVLSRICPAAMLFVRCAGGISHDPRESVSEEDVAVALDVLERAVRAS
jgi:hydantoinase/carbamoylase family amidase